MSDKLLELSANPNLRRVVRQLGLPVSLPQRLRRVRGSFPTLPLAHRSASLLGSDGPIADALHARFASAGAVVRRDASAESDVLVWVATDVDAREGMDALYALAHASVRNVRRQGRVVVVGLAPEDAESASARARRAALDGFTRSVAKEVGRKGATANRVVVSEHAAREASEVALYLSSDAASFVTAQSWRVTPASGLAPWTRRALEGKTAVVTGAARGIGNAIAYALFREGARVIAVDRPSAALERVARGVEGVAVAADVCDPAHVDAIRSAAGDAGVDVFVPNAGVTRDRTLGRMSREEWDLVMDVNLDAVMSSTEALLDEGLNPDARVVLISSIGGIAGNPGQTNYGATKAGVIGLARALAPVFEARGGTINAIAPGLIETAMTAKMPAMTREVARRLAVLGQGGVPDDIAHAVAFLASAASGGVNGQTLRVCGGNLVGA